MQDRIVGRSSALIAGLFGRVIGDRPSELITTLFLMISAVLSWIVFIGVINGTQEGVEKVPLLTWLSSGTLEVSWSLRIDTLTAVMLVVVNTVSSLVHLYSIGYMHEDPHRPRFFAYLSLFTFAMLMLVTSDNLLQMFFGWEGVGLASYLLIGFWYHKPEANAAAMKAFIVNRVGDFGFALGIFGVFAMTGSIDLDTVFGAAPGLAGKTMPFLSWQLDVMTVLCLLLFMGAMGKSAQILLHTWLPDAMEGPTPVSALIHAATMVTAGVFMVARLSPLFEQAPVALEVVTFIGATTAFFAATVGLVQNDIKRVIAYSTCSQLGYMFVAAGVGVYSAAMFHLLTHAFFKALLFLGAGSVIHAMHHEQDMRNYGGLRKKIPLTFWAMMIGTFAITGVGIPLTHIGFAGFLSKDAIIESAYASGVGFAFWALVVAACFTSFYSWRLIFLTFYGEARWGQGGHGAHGHDAHGHDDHGHGAHAHEPHESPATMTVPLVVLALGSIFAGMLWYGDFFGDPAKVEAFFNLPAHEAAAEGTATTETTATATKTEAAPAAADHAAVGAILMTTDVMEQAHAAPDWVKVSPFIAMVLGFVTAWMFYIRNPSLPRRLAATQPILYRFLLNKWYFDEIYDALIVRPARSLGAFLWKRGDGNVIDGSINGVAMGIVPFFTRLAGRAQSGYLFHYAFAMVIGIAVLLFWMTLSGGAH